MRVSAADLQELKNLLELCEKLSPEQVSGWIRLINTELESGPNVTSIVARQGAPSRGPYATVDSVSRANPSRAGQRAHVEDEDAREDRVRQLAERNGYLLGHLPGVGREGAFNWVVSDLHTRNYVGAGPNTASTLEDVEEYIHDVSGE